MTDSVEASMSRDLAGHPTADPALEGAVKRIAEISRRYEEAMRTVAGRYDISLGDCQVIFELAHSEPTERTPGHLARAFHITAGSVTARLGRLERGGFLRRTVDADNRVHVQIALTESGHAMHHEVSGELIELRRTLIADALPAADLTQLNTLLRRVLTHIETTDQT
ncbi:MarR family winged helix-turn-helix transcriptional regulator [Fodinicola feengrottensis]|uniref:HTH marR-type domain-containing protein n=1 Tax=Fodinicola feengrottensis TaxID=435914 RepID=A0ABN2HZB0_9ACTN|nr:MarR family winged helix-turn-helix transcriptional regulator [Fodinicola feengrottensis]